MQSEFLAHPHTLSQIEQYLSAPVHAIGLCGEAGAGKGHAALYIAAKLLDTSLERVLTHPYVLQLDVQAQKTGIDDMRELQKFLTLTVPGKGTIKRIVILEHFDTIRHEAQNSMLKTLEEPPSDTVIMVTYSRSTSILPTIHSRLRPIQLLPLGLEHAQNAFKDYDSQELFKAFLISGGLIGLIIALLQDKADHPLLKAINQSREIVGLSRFKRLANVDSLAKNTDVPPASLLDGLYRLVNASYQQSLKTKSNDELSSAVKRLKLIEEAIQDLDQNVQAKLVLSRLFISL